MEHRFELIQGGKKEAKPEQPGLVCCSTCHGTTFIEAIGSPVRIDDAIEGGSKLLVCVQCLAEGQVNTI